MTRSKRKERVDTWSLLNVGALSIARRTLGSPPSSTTLALALCVLGIHGTVPEIPRTPACSEDAAVGQHLVCGQDAGASCMLAGRFRFPAHAMEQRGDLNGNAMAHRGGVGLGKVVAKAMDLRDGALVFIKCESPPGGRGTVHGIKPWRGPELEGILHGLQHVLTPQCSMAMFDGGECRVYERAMQSLTDGMTGGRLEGFEMLKAILQVSNGIAAIHHSGFCHRDIKHRNILQYNHSSGGLVWAVGDLDAAAREGDVIHEFMGYPW